MEADISRTPLTDRLTLNVILIVTVLLGLAPAAHALEEVKCWEAALYDLDGDGYAAYYSNKDDRETRLVPAHEALTCDAGWVPMRGDTDDSDPDVHPRRREVKNGIDDNCDGRVDEATFFYYVGGLGNTTSSFTMRVRVNRQIAINAVTSSTNELWYRIEFHDLSRPKDIFTLARRRADGAIVKPGGSYARFDATLTGLEPGTVYRARVYLYIRSLATGIFYNVGGESPWYYTITDANGDVGQARTRLVLRAFYEYYLSEQGGRAGYLGSEPDGTRYGADMGEWWCSEFYSWVTDYELDGMGHRSNAKKIANYFAMYGGWAWLEPGGHILRLLEPGDYLGVATGSDPDEITHSAMFLAYDELHDTVWSLDGNTNGYSDIESTYSNRRGTNQTFVRSREGTTIVGAGHILERMLP